MRLAFQPGSQLPVRTWQPGMGDYIPDYAGEAGGYYGDTLDFGGEDYSTGAVVGAIGGAQLGYSTSVSTGSIVAGTIAGALAFAGSIPSPASPFLLAAAAIVGPIASFFKGCGQTCIISTQYVDETEQVLKRLSAAYWSHSVRTVAMRDAFLHTFREIQGALVRACSNPALGEAGQRCVAFHAEANAGMAPAPWCNDGSGCPDSGACTSDTTHLTKYCEMVPNAGRVGCDSWSSLYYPVLCDDVVPDPVAQVQGQSNGTAPTTQGQVVNQAQEILNTVSGAVGGIPGPLLLIGGGLLVSMLVLGDK